jgi:hypothetical protein
MNGRGEGEHLEEAPSIVESQQARMSAELRDIGDFIAGGGRSRIHDCEITGEV